MFNSNLNEKYITDLFNRFKTRIFEYENKEGECSLELLLEDLKTENKELVCAYLISILKYFVSSFRLEKKPKTIKKLKHFFEEHFTVDDVLFVMMNHKYSADELLRQLHEIFPEKFEHYELWYHLTLSSWQFVYEKQKFDVAFEIYETMTNLPKMKDDRFSAETLYSGSCYGWSIYTKSLEDKGSNWQKSLETGELSLDNSKRYYIDGKFGIMIYFKNKPSMLASFNFDDKKNLYIYQIQAQHKSRGHYKLGKEWREEVVNYIKNTFKGFKIHLIKGEASALLSTRGYTGEYDKYKSTLEEQRKIAKIYNSMFPKSSRYRRLKSVRDGLTHEQRESIGGIKFKKIA